MTKAVLYARIDSMRKKYGIKGSFDPWEFAKNHGYEIRFHSFDDNNVKGFLVRVPGAARQGIILDKNLTREEQRCILAHELVHSELHGAFSRLYEVDKDSSSYTEYQADEGAAELLIPYREFIPEVCRMRKMLNARPALITGQLAKKYGVDSEYIRRRIKSLEYETGQYIKGVPIDKIELRSRYELEKNNVLSEKLIKTPKTPQKFDINVTAD